MNLTPELVWLFAGIFLIFTEFFIPGVVIVFFGVGALMTSFAILMTDGVDMHLSLPLQMLIFLISSIGFMMLLRNKLKATFLGKALDDGEQRTFNIEVGKMVSVVELIEPGEIGGRVRYQGTLWSARSEHRHMPGESVVIVGCDNLTLIVEPLKNKE
jgi:membrane protein implicated in regulation of membrane protease activity